MPRYFFHVIDSRAILDTEGVELPGITEARDQAIRAGGDILVSEGDKFWDRGKWQMSVADESGKVHFTLNFSADTHEA